MLKEQSENQSPSKREKCRVALRSRLDERARYIGTFEKNGIKRGYRGPLPTILLKDITDATGFVVTDHLWMNETKALRAAELKTGDKVAFDARVEKYVKGYFGRRDDVWAPPSIDYRLSRPTRVSIVERAVSPPNDIEAA